MPTSANAVAARATWYLSSPRSPLRINMARWSPRDEMPASCVTSEDSLMAKPLVYYDDLDVGDALPTLVKQPTTRQLVKYAGASGDYYEIHYDHQFAVKSGL